MSMTDAPVTAFFNILNNAATPGFHTSAQLLADVFCTDSGTAPNQVPVVGITEHGGPLGPRFIGTVQVGQLFDQLFQSFPDIALTTVGPRLYPKATGAADIIAVQADLTGSYQSIWFQKPDARHSLPLSAINPVVNAATGAYKGVKIAAVPVFTCVGNRVTQLAIYMDRYKFTSSITLATPAVFEREMSNLLQHLSGSSYP
jgi:hypothetical protein